MISFPSKTQLASLCFGLVMAFPADLMAQTIPIPSFQAAEEYAMSHLVDFKIWEKSLLKSEVDLKNSQGALFPQIKATGNFDDYLQLPIQLLPAEVVGGEPGTFTEIAFGTQYQVNLSLEASLPLVNTSLWNQVKAAKIQNQLKINEIDAQKQQWREQLARAYYLTLLNEVGLEISESNQTSADSILNVAQIQFDQGIMDPLPFQRIKAKAFTARNQYELQVKNTGTIRNSLRILLGMDFAGDFRLTEQLDESQAQDPSSDYPITSLPDWKVAQSNLELADRNMLAARQSYLPTLSAIGRYSQQSWSNDLKIGDYAWYEVAQIGLRLEWNIFKGNQLRNQARSAKLDRELALLAVNQTEERLTQEKTDLQIDLLQNAKLMKNYRQSYGLFQENFRLAQIQFAEGLLSTDELLQIQQELWDNQRQYLNALADYFVTKAMVEIKAQN